jgi:hypothetical protein
LLRFQPVIWVERLPAFSTASQGFGNAGALALIHKEKFLAGATCHPADDQHAFADYVGGRTIAQGKGELSQQYTAKQEHQSGD